jgi:Winged helix-turn helix
MEIDGPPRRFGNRLNPNDKETRVHIVPRIDRAERRHLMRTGRKANDVATVLRFYAVALLGGGKSSPEVADMLNIAVSTVVRAAHAYLAQGIAGLYDKRRSNGRPKADGAFRARVAEQGTGTRCASYGKRAAGTPSKRRSMAMIRLGRLACTPQCGEPAVELRRLRVARMAARGEGPRSRGCAPWPVWHQREYGVSGSERTTG